MNENQIVLFESNDQEVTIPVNLDSQTVWLSQAQMAQLFDRSIGVVSRHIKTSSLKVSLSRKAICIFCKNAAQTARLLCTALM